MRFDTISPETAFALRQLTGRLARQCLAMTAELRGSRIAVTDRHGLASRIYLADIDKIEGQLRRLRDACATGAPLTAAEFRRAQHLHDQLTAFVDHHRAEQVRTRDGPARAAPGDGQSIANPAPIRYRLPRPTRVPNNDGFPPGLSALQDYSYQPAPNSVLFRMMLGIAALFFAIFYSLK